MERMTKWRDNMSKAPGLQHSFDFIHHKFRKPDVFQHCVAFDSLKSRVGKRKIRCIRNNIDAREPEEVKVDVAFHDTAATPNVKVPAAKRGNDILPGVHDERLRWFQSTANTISEVAGSASDI
jgi:hypothetical protein